MFRKVMTMVLIGGSLAVAACNTVRGAATDVNRRPTRSTTPPDAAMVVSPIIRRSDHGS